LLRQRKKERLTRLSPHPIWLGILFGVFIAPLSLLWFFYVTDRFLLPYLVISIILFGIATHYTISNIWGRRELWAVTMAMLSLIVALGIWPTQWAARTVWGGHYNSLRNVINERHGSTGFVQAGRWLRKHSTDTKDMALLGPRKVHVVLTFAGDLSRPLNVTSGKYRYIKNLNLSQISDLLHSKKYRYLVLDKFHTPRSAPQFMKLWNDPSIAQEYGLQIVNQEPGLYQIYEASQ
jgi:hypothetical protein